ncbi:SDR family NAD(P)-dependent oxidoreductase [Vibrio coralliilyticus]|uniref:SDR family NAD(P)-dependent oxidoreductase n=1 Tax=Vibrio coralliilyticus TaxID=190893 RepID=UPI0017B07562|nr:SDR family oxidoreductase [Vibrio coralliilyticus]NUW67206.1 SDR family oxidoreductase [Vibrio coralliilyticus]
MKTVLITGGSKGIGLEAVKMYASKGEQVITCARTMETWDDVIATNPELFSVDFQVVDISDRDQVEALFDYLTSEYGKLDIAINNASPKLESNGQFSEVDSDELYKTLVNDLWSHTLCLKHELLLMSEGASIVNISSINGIRPTPNASMYSATKHGLEGLTRSVALEAIKDGIRVNSVAPGVTWTPRWEERQASVNPNIRSEVESVVPIGRFAEPAEIVNAIEWLCSDQASYVVGHTLVVDGGLSQS